MRPFFALVTLLALGCGYAHGSIDYSAHPRLRNVTLYTGEPDPRGEDVATVEASHEGDGSCTEVAQVALQELLDDAEAVGADGVKDVRFRGRWHWMGRVVCGDGAFSKSVRVRGQAYRDPE